MAPDAATENLGVLLANERQERLDAVAEVVRSAGHEVVASTLVADEVGALTRSARPDVAVVAVGHDPEHALDQIEGIAADAVCPVIVLLGRSDPELVAEAARRGAFGHALDTGPDELQSSIEIALRRFLELRALESAFRRRALVERAKGILMERHGIDEQAAFGRLRSEARNTGATLVAVAEAVLASHRLLRDERSA